MFAQATAIALKYFFVNSATHGRRFFQTINVAINRVILGKPTEQANALLVVVFAKRLALCNNQSGKSAAISNSFAKRWLTPLLEMPKMAASSERLASGFSKRAVATSFNCCGRV